VKGRVGEACAYEWSGGENLCDGGLKCAHGRGNDSGRGFDFLLVHI
jgi:hypothetical protein